MSAPTLVSSLPEHRSIAVYDHGGAAPDSSPTEVVHDHCSIGLYLSGSARFWMRRQYQLQRGDVLLVPEGMPHIASDEGAVQMVGLVLCTHCMRGAWGDSLRRAFADVRFGAIAVRRLDVDAVDRVAALVRGIERELDKPAAAHDLMVDGLMSQFCAEIVRARPVNLSVAGSGWPEMIANALEFIEKNAAFAISLSDVAEAVARAPAHVAASMRQHTGRTVVDWITHGRMALARELLRTTDQSVTTVAEAVGYASPSHFHRTFRRAHGATPAQWRNAHR